MTRISLLSAAALFVLLGPSLGRGQTQIQQTGRLFDANPEVGGSGYNQPHRNTPFSAVLGGNALATGNARFGQSLRINSPVSSPFTFRAGLGSGSLSSFVRDSVSVADSVTPRGGLVPTRFFDPARTTTSLTFLDSRVWFDANARRDPFGGPTPRGTLPGLLNYGGPIDARLPVEPLDVPRLDSSVSTLLSESDSTIFGLPQQPRAPSPVDGREARDYSGILDEIRNTRHVDPTEPLADAMPERRDFRSPLGRPLDLRKDPQASLEGFRSPLDSVVRGDANALLEQDVPQVVAPWYEQAEEEPMLQRPLEASQLTGLLRDSRQSMAEGAAEALEVPAPSDLTMLPGNDLFTDMQLALALTNNPDADWFPEMMRTLEHTQREGADESLAQLEAQAFVDRVLNAPLRTFVGERPSALNDELLKAESLLEIGQYYAAVKRYERAHMMDPANPLPLLGKGHALLAAGDYLSSSLFIIRGLERFPELTRFDLDLERLLGGGEIVDIRRADLMERLARTDSPQLRFLLGYLELHTGNRVSGMENLRKAAAAADVGSFISRYPAMLGGSGSLPPAQLPDANAVPPLEAPSPERPEAPGTITTP